MDSGYNDNPCPLAKDRHLSTVHVALMTEALELTGKRRFFEIGRLRLSTALLAQACRQGLFHRANRISGQRGRSCSITCMPIMWRSGLGTGVRLKKNPLLMRSWLRRRPKIPASWWKQLYPCGRLIIRSGRTPRHLTRRTLSENRRREKKIWAVPFSISIGRARLDVESYPWARSEKCLFLFSAIAVCRCRQQIQTRMSPLAKWFTSRR